MTLIGIGLIGGSLALAARKNGLVSEVVGVARREETLTLAKRLGMLERSTQNLANGVKDSDLVVIATPVGSIVDIARKILPYLKEGTIITDVGSVKEKIVREIEPFLPQNLSFVGGHPIAGTENSGPQAAFDHLFAGRFLVLTPTKKTDLKALERIKRFWEAIGSKVIIMDAAIHDKIFAAISHLPHFVAYCLVNSVLYDMKDFEDNPIRYAAGGFRDFTRIAQSNPEMWRDIFIMNKENILKSIKDFESTLERIRKYIEEGEEEQLFEEFKKSKELKSLKGF